MKTGSDQVRKWHRGKTVLQCGYVVECGWMGSTATHRSNPNGNVRTKLGRGMR